MGGAPQQMGGGGGGQKGIPLNIGGTNINPGVFIYADKDGVIISQRQLAPGQTANYGTAGGMGMSSITGGGLTGGSSPYGAAGGAGASMAGGMGGSTSPYGSTPGSTSPYGSSPGSTSPYGSSPGSTSPYGSTPGTRGAASYSSPYTGARKKKLSKKSLLAFMLILIWFLYSWSG